MRSFALLACVLLPPLRLMLGPAMAHAGQAEAKAAAREANCPPGKVQVLSQTVGSGSQTVFKITCTGMKNMYVLVQCREELCVALQ